MFVYACVCVEREVLTGEGHEVILEGEGDVLYLGCRDVLINQNSGNVLLILIHLNVYKIYIKRKNSSQSKKNSS